MERDYINPSASANSIPRGYSHVVRVRNANTLVYIAGEGPLDDQLRVIGGDDFEAQVHATFKNIQRCLEHAGATFSDVVKMNVYVTDIKNQQWPFRNVRAEYIDTEKPPVSTMIEVPRLAVDGMMVEVDLVAALP